jgi:hypothetical protein
MAPEFTTVGNILKSQCAHYLILSRNLDYFDSLKLKIVAASAIIPPETHSCLPRIVLSTNSNFPPVLFFKCISILLSPINYAEKNV